MRTSLLGVAAAMSMCLTANVNARQAREAQNVTLSEKLQIPGAVLKSGEYTFSVEDRMQDRAIVRISSTSGGKHFLLLTVPNAQLRGSGGEGLVFFSSSDTKNRALRGWSCPGCSSTLEFVYPKAEAAKLTETTSEPVIAVDPESDKLPANLSPDDMKVVTLWLLSPKPITATDRTKGVEAAKYVPAANAVSTETARESTPAAPSTPAREVAPTPARAMRTSEASAPAAPVEMASASTAPNGQPGQRRSRLPKTATNNFELIFCGLALMLAAGSLRVSRRRRTVR